MKILVAGAASVKSVGLEEKEASHWINRGRGEFMTRYAGVKHNPDEVITMVNGAIIAVETERSMKTIVAF